MTSASNGTYAGQYPCDGWVDNLEPTPSVEYPSWFHLLSTTNTCRVQTPSNVPIERSHRDLATPLFVVACAPLVSAKSVSEPCLNKKEKSNKGLRHVTYALQTTSCKRPGSKCSLWAFVNYVSKFGVFIFFRPNIEPFSALCFLFLDVLQKKM